MPTSLLIGLLAVSLAFPASPVSQEQRVSSPPNAAPYANTADGLRQLLLDMRAAAKDGNQEKLAAFIKDTEVPNCDAWLHRMYDSDKADSWMGLCEAKSRDPRERNMRELFGQIAKQDGKLFTRKVNDNPQPGKGLEWGWLQAIKQPLDIYWASWLPNGESETDPIGYFMFIDGGFRWESTFQSFKPSQIKTTHAKIIPPKLIKRVEPVYPPEAAAQHVVGTVHVTYLIGGDGRVYNVHALSGEGFSEDPSLRKAAEDAVLQWQFEPGTFDGKPYQTQTTVDIAFSLKR